MWQGDGIFIIKYNLISMETDRWEDKIRFFSKFLGFEEDPEMEETLD